MKRSELKSGNFCSKMFSSGNSKVAKSFPSREKKSKKCKSVEVDRPPKADESPIWYKNGERPWTSWPRQSDLKLLKLCEKRVEFLKRLNYVINFMMTKFFQILPAESDVSQIINTNNYVFRFTGKVDWTESFLGRKLTLEIYDWNSKLCESAEQ